MVLWKKESDADGALYIDLLALDEPIDQLFNQMLTIGETLEKNNDISTDLRNSGNDQFKANNWREAMFLYNQSLQFATEGSENISLAYANRSTCFLKMEMYEECLVDIELAKNANYPQRLMAKLEQRKADCLKRMNGCNQDRIKIKPVLSFPPDEMFPCLANVLEIQSNDEFGKHIVAKSDIKVGEIVLLEEFFASGTEQCGKALCQFCLRSTKNFIPCPNCTEVMFCDEKCMELNKIHEMGCSASYNRTNVTGIIRNIESILIAVSAFPEADDLIKFVESALATRDIDSLKGLPSEQMRYGVFLKLLAKPNDVEGALAVTYRNLMNIPKIQQYFDSQQKQRFLMHLIGQHHRILQTNGFHEHHENNEIASIAIVSSLFNHSCSPNIVLQRTGNHFFGHVVRLVKMGEQLFINYRMGCMEQMIESTTMRRTYLRKKLELECKCSRCVPSFKQEDCIRMQLDPDFQFFSHIFDKIGFWNNRSVLKEKYISFLSKYGRLPWSIEIECAMFGFSKCVEEEYGDI